MPETKYDAFVSYRRSDGAKVAHWLRRELQSFRPPKALRQHYGRSLRVYLDTAYERGTSDFYENSIRPALLASRYLLVVATPAARRRAGGVEDWMQREVSDFSAGPNGSNVIAVRGAGEFNDPLPADLIERFPNIEIVDLRGAGRLWYLNPTRAARLSAEKLKLVAPLLDVPHEEMPRLRQEEEKLQQGRLGSAIGATLGVLVAVSGLSIFALQSRNAATRALEDSMFATGSMVLLSTNLPQGRGEKDARSRRLLINQGCDLIDKLAEGSGRQPQIAELVTCRLERAHARERLEEHAEARKQFEEAIGLAADRYGKSERNDAGTRLVEAREAFAQYLIRQKDAAGAEAEYGRLLADARRMGEAHSDRDEYKQAEGEALGRLGDLLAGRGQRAKAADSFEAAAKAVGRLVEAQASRQEQDLRAIGWLARLHRLAGEQHMHEGDAAGALERYRRSLEVRSRIEGSVPPDIELETALVNGLIYHLQRRGTDRRAADAAKGEALAAIERVLAQRALSADLQRRASQLKGWIEQQAAAN
jgi:tetratricopeptide (TPR) repeat protein